MSKHHGFYSGPTQIAWACDALLSGRTIGHDDEIGEVNGWRLAAIVWRLKNAYGWPVDTIYTGPENHARYKLALDCNRSNLRFPPSARHLGKGGVA